MTAGVFFDEYFTAFSILLAARIPTCDVDFDPRNLPKFKKKKSVVVWPVSSRYEVPRHAGNIPLQLYFDVLTFQADVRAESFVEAIRLRQLVLSAFHDAREAEPFLNCTFTPIGSTYEPKEETDSYYVVNLSCEFGSPIYYGSDDVPVTGIAHFAKAII